MVKYPCIRETFFSLLHLLHLEKKDVGIRIIAVGNVFRRIATATKTVCKSVTKDIAARLLPILLGVGVPGGCEGNTHTARSFFRIIQASHIVVKLIVRNALNSVRRDHDLEVCKRRCP